MKCNKNPIEDKRFQTHSIFPCCGSHVDNDDINGCPSIIYLKYLDRDDIYELSSAQTVIFSGITTENIIVLIIRERKHRFKEASPVDFCSICECYHNIEQTTEVVEV